MNEAFKKAYELEKRQQEYSDAQKQAKQKLRDRYMTSDKFRKTIPEEKYGY